MEAFDLPTDSELWTTEELFLSGHAFRTGHAAIPTGLERCHGIAALAAAVERTGDEDAMVRRTACQVLAVAPPYEPVAGNRLAARLTDQDPDVRVEAAARPALRDDPRGDEILRDLDPADENSPYRRLLHDVHRHRRRC